MTTTGQEPVFVLSAERSGSTLCRYILDSHDYVGAPGELTLGELCASLLRVLIRLRAPSLQPYEEIPREICIETRKIVDDIMVVYLDKLNKTIWCEKSPANLKFLPALSYVFPDARYICLYRSFLDTAWSCMSVSHLGFVPTVQEYVSKYPGNLMMAMAESWVDKAERLMAFENGHIDHCIRVRYEDLVLDPNREMHKIFDFLKLAWNPRLLETVLLSHHDEGGGDSKIRSEKEIHQRSVGVGGELPIEMIARPLIERINTLLLALKFKSLHLPRA